MLRNVLVAPCATTQHDGPAPRTRGPREGPAAVDAMIVPLLQKKVLHKVMRQLNWTKSEFMRAKILQRQIDTDAVKAGVRPQQSCCFFVIDRNRSHRNHLKSSGMPPNKEQILETLIYDPRSVTIFEGDVEKYFKVIDNGLKNSIYQIEDKLVDSESFFNDVSFSSLMII